MLFFQKQICAHQNMLRQDTNLWLPLKYHSLLYKAYLNCQCDWETSVKGKKSGELRARAARLKTSTFAISTKRLYFLKNTSLSTFWKWAINLFTSFIVQFRFLIGNSFLASLLGLSPSINCDSLEFFLYSMMENLAVVAISFTSPGIKDALGLDLFWCKRYYGANTLRIGSSSFMWDIG